MTRLRWFPPRGMREMERGGPEGSEMMRPAFLRGISRRGAGRVAPLVTEESASARTVSRLTRVLDERAAKFRHARLGDEWRYPMLVLGGAR